MILASITPTQVIEGLGFIVVVIGLFLKLARDKSDIDVAINANSIKIIELERNLLQMKKEYEKQNVESNERLTRTQTNFFNALAELKKDNRQDHLKVFEKLEEVGENIASIVAYINYENAGENSNDRKRDARKKIKKDEA